MPNNKSGRRSPQPVGIMKKYVLFSILFFSFTSAPAQIPDSIQFDSESGNYIIRFEDDAGPQRYIWEFEPSTKIHPFVDLEITYDAGSSFYTYNYLIRNGKNSRQLIREFAVELYGSYTNQIMPDNNWFSVQFAEPPSIGWALKEDAPDAAGIGIGSDLNGFRLFSSDIPGIIPCYFSGRSKTRFIPEILPDSIETYFKQRIRFPSDRVQRYTIGPVGEPDTLSTIAATRRLIALTDKGFEMGWIQRVRFYNQIITELENIGELINADISTITINRLNQLIKTLEEKDEDCLKPEYCRMMVLRISHLIRQLE